MIVRKASMDKRIPFPSVMPVNRQKWRDELHLSNFVNSYYQYRDVQSCGDARKLLVVGPGQGLDTQVFRWRGYDVTTLDIDETFGPDVIGSVHDLSVFDEASFDAVIVSHVLEHLPAPYLNGCLKELSRVGKYSIIYLPVAGRHFQFRAQFDTKCIDLSFILDVYNRFHKPDGVTPKYCGGQHYWEIGYRGFRVKDMEERMLPFFEIISVYRNPNWNPSMNFVLRSKHGR